MVAAVAQSISLFYRVVPADHTLATSSRAELDLSQKGAKRVIESDLGDKYVGADFCIVGLAAPDVVDGLSGDASALKKFRSECVRGGHVGSKAVAFI